jgi:hypothetical protein
MPYDEGLTDKNWKLDAFNYSKTHDWTTYILVHWDLN